MNHPGTPHRVPGSVDHTQKRADKPSSDLESMMTLKRRTFLAATGATATLAGLPLAGAQAAPTPRDPAAPRFTNATVHDPDHIEVDGTHYFFGSHLASASTTNLMALTQLTTSVSASNPLFDDVTVELAETFEWAQSNTLWAPDVVRLDDGRFRMFYNACKGDSPRSAMGIAVADKVTGPYRDQGVILKSGMWDEISPDGTVYDARVHPNAVDPDVYRSPDGRLWMVYGSYSGGIFILQLDPASGRPLPGQGYGRHIWGGNHARIEGAAMFHDPVRGYYYLFATYGGLDASGGYNIRVVRSKAPNGPFVDAEGHDMAQVKADPAKPLFDDASIAEAGVKLMGNHLFARAIGDPGEGPGVGYVSPGGCTVFVDGQTGQTMIAFHTRFPGRGEEHEVRVHRLLFTDDGWPVIAPLRFAGEGTASLKRAEQVGTYAVVDHAPRTISADLHRARTVTLGQDGRLRGALSGSWERDGQNRGWFTIDGVRTQVLFARQWDPDQALWTTTFVTLGAGHAAIAGVRKVQVTPAEAVRRVMADLSLPTTTVVDLELPTLGTQGSTIVWRSSEPGVISTQGAVVRPAVGELDATVVLTATVTNGSATATQQFTVLVPARLPGGLKAEYLFNGDLTESAGRQAAGQLSGPRIGQTGGKLSFTDGIRGQALLLDGSTGVRLPDGLVQGATWSVSLWLRPTRTAAYTTSFFAARDADHWVSLLPQGHGGVGGDSMVWSGTQWYDGGFGRRIAVGQWSHVAFTVDSGRLTAWVNGEQVFDGTGFPDVLTADSGVFSLGVNWWDEPYQGAVDELRVFDAPLSAEQVAELARR